MFSTYPKMKESGVEWLGEIPTDWMPFRLGMLGVFSASGIDKKIVEGESLVQMVNYTDVYGSVTKELAPRAGFMIVSCPEEKVREHGLAVGDILFTPSSETADDIAYSAVVVKDMPNTVYSYHLIRFRPKADIAVGYRKYICNNRFVLSQFTRACKGTTRQILVRDDFKNVVAVIPPSAEQEAIASFLDRKTALIDDLIAKRERQIGLLQEHRSAIISQAVTKGLNPDAPMKDSGVEWLGEVPEHWDIAAVRRYAKRVQTGSTPPTYEERYYEDGTIPWFGPGSFDDMIEVKRPIKKIHESAVSEGVARIFSAGATLIVTIGATLGKVSSLTEASSCNQQITVIEFDPRNVYPRFATYQIKRLEPVLRAIAPRATLPILDQGEIADIILGLPEISEQQAIASFLDNETAKIDTFVTKVQQSIEKLREYRESLISVAVTGKIGVRNWQPSSDPAEESIHV